MTKIQPGLGYGFRQSGWGVTFDTTTPFPEPTFYARSPAHPFKVLQAGLVNDQPSFRVLPGTVNSLVPMLGITPSAARRLDHTPPPTEPWSFNTTTNQAFIYLRVGCDTSADPPAYPVADQGDSLYPSVVLTIVEQENNPDSGKVLIATAYRDPTTQQISVNQILMNNIGTERHEFENPQLIQYYFWAQ